jgi:flagellum-specific peptidoglycan hydrolase FlgJ
MLSFRMKTFGYSARLLAVLFFLAAAVEVSAQNGYTYPLAPEAQTVARTLSNVYGADPVYVESFLREALVLEQNQGIPAVATVGIAVLESGGFTSELFRQSQNPFGIKASSPWQGAVVAYWHDQQLTPFRAYGSAEEAVQDFGRFLYTRRWFADAFRCANGDYSCFLDALTAAGREPGYSLDPSWAEKVRDVIIRNDLTVLRYQGTAGN